MGRIMDLGQEQAGPGVSGGGFAPCELAIDEQTAGVWQIVFVAPDPDSWKHAQSVAADAPWVQEADVYTIASWDITVRDIQGDRRSGRVFFEHLPVNMGDETASLFTTVYALTDDGYTYEVSLQGIQPHTFSLFANEKGFESAVDGEPLYASIPLDWANTSNGGLPVGVTIARPAAVGSFDLSDRTVHKLFFDTPDPSLPAIVSSGKGAVSFRQSPRVPARIEGFLYTGSVGKPGSFSFETEANHRYEITIDVSDNGVWGDGNDVILRGSAIEGQNHVVWDGNDREGIPVPGIENGYRVRIRALAGEIHLPFVDVENNPYGIQLRRLQDPSAPAYTVFYDDASVQETASRSGAKGEDSRNGAHAYVQGFGDELGLDTWSYAASAPLYLEPRLFVAESDMRVALQMDDGALGVRSGVQTTLTVEVANDGPFATSQVRLALRLPSEITLQHAVPSAGTFNASDGVWTIPSFPNGAIERLTLMVVPQASGAYPVHVELIDQQGADPDSTPNNFDDEQQDRAYEDDEGRVDVYVDPLPAIGVAKRLLDISGGADGFTAQMEVTLENTGNTPLNDVQVDDLLPAALMGTDYRIVNVEATEPLHVNPLFDGKSVTTLLEPGVNRLEIGERGVLTYAVEGVPVASFGPYESQAEGFGRGLDGQFVSDMSDEGTTADANNNGFAGDEGEDDPTVIRLPQRPALGAALQLYQLSGRASQFTATCIIHLENLGDVPLTDLAAMLDLGTPFGAGRYSISNWNAPSSFVLNPDYDGAQETQLLAPGSELRAGQQGQISFSLQAFPQQAADAYVLSASVRGVSPGGVTVADVSDAGDAPDSNGNRIAGEVGENDATIITFEDVPVIGAALSARRVSGDLDGFTAQYDLRIKNLGSTPLYDVQAIADLSTAFKGSSFAPSNMTTASSVELDPEFDGIANKNLIGSQDVPLLPGQTFVISYHVNVQPETYFGPYQHAVFVKARNDGGVVATDLSHLGKEVDPDGDGNPDEASENQFHEIRFAPKAALGTALGINRVEGGLDAFKVFYTIVVENLSDVTLGDVSIHHPLDTTFAGARVEVAHVTTDGPLVLNALYDGSRHIELIDPSSEALDIGEKTTIDLELTVFPRDRFGPYFLGAVSSAETPMESTVRDVTAEGLEPDGNNNGDPTELAENRPTFLSIDERPAIGAAMDVTRLEGDLESFIARHVLRVANLGDVPLHALQGQLDLAQMYEGAEIKVVRRAVRSGGSGRLVVNDAFDGIEALDLLAASPGALGLGDTVRIEIDVNVQPGGNFGPYEGHASVSAEGPQGTQTSDLSDRGTAIDLNENGLANEVLENRPSSIAPQTSPAIGVARSVTGVRAVPGGGFEVGFEIIVRNLGDVPLAQLQVIEDLASFFGDVEVAVISVSLSEESGYTVNTQFDGFSHTTLLGESDAILEPGGYVGIDVVLRVGEDMAGGMVSTSSDAMALEPGGLMVTDVSTDGIDPDPNGNGHAGEAGENDPTVVTFRVEDRLELDTRIERIEGDDQEYRLTLAASLTNRGQSALRDLDLALDLGQSFDGVTVRIDHVRLEGFEGGTLLPGFDGTTVTSILDAAQSWLAAGQRLEIEVDLTVTPGVEAGPYELQFIARSQSASEVQLEEIGSRHPIAVATSSGEDAGLESNGDLSLLLAQRTYRHRNQTRWRKNREAPLMHILNANGVHGTGLLNASEIFDLIPQEGPEGSTGFAKTPVDLFGVTNATSVYAVDYLLEGQRLAGLFAVSSPAGEIYDHTKNICDRLQGGTLVSVDHVSVRGYPFVLSTLVQASGDVDYAVSFISYRNGANNWIDSRFIRDDYDAVGASVGEVLNFQVWSYAPGHTLNIVEEILDRMEHAGRIDFVSREADVPAIPSTYVASGTYDGGQLQLLLRHTPGVNAYRLTGETSYVESGEKERFDHMVLVSEAQASEAFIPVSIPTDPLFDALLHVTNDLNQDVDQVYLADGAWGHVVDPSSSDPRETSTNNDDDQQTVVEQFEVLRQSPYEQNTDRHVVERGLHFRGTVSDSVTIFRYFKPGGGAIDLGDFDYLSFVATGKGEVAMMLESTMGTEQIEEVITLSKLPKTYTYRLKDRFESDQTARAFLAQVEAIQFNVRGAEDSGEATLLVEDIFFGKGIPVSVEEEEALPLEYGVSQNYPNPYASQTSINITLPVPGSVRVEVFDMLGRRVQTLVDREYQAGRHVVRMDAGMLASGAYVYRMDVNGFASARIMHVYR